MLDEFNHIEEVLSVVASQVQAYLTVTLLTNPANRPKGSRACLLARHLLKLGT